MKRPTNIEIGDGKQEAISSICLTSHYNLQYKHSRICLMHSKSTCMASQYDQCQAISPKQYQLTFYMQDNLKYHSSNVEVILFLRRITITNTYHNYNKIRQNRL